ncbi:MAG: RsmB/NOP family class I SAM-dependent RNA methyltransferase [Chloroflexi bacterium]|nr:RsmB/NOP family class I SAM-dependent RNA methyltransferase [Chloroflexota bacterium]
MPPAASLPPLFLEKMRRLLAQEYPAFLASYDLPPSAGLRVNTLKISPAAFQAISPFPLSPLPWAAEGFILSATPAQPPSPGKHPYHAAGLYYLQDPSAMATAALLAPRPGERVLDLAGAPGGKTTHLAALMQGEGLLIANEIHPKRVWELASNLERWGAPNALIANETPAHLAQALPGFFDRVLLDAPCSGEGMFRKNEAARLEWSPQLVASCALRQSAILDEAARLVRPGGRLVYSTCTFSPEENEAVVLRFLETHAEFELAEMERLPGAAPAFNDEAGRPPGLRLWPQRAPGEGHFLAALTRRDGNIISSPRPAALARLSPQERALWRQFSRANLAGQWEEADLRHSGGYLYRLPPGSPSLDGLRIVHPGLWLGQFKPGRFEPAHALALALRAGQAQRTIDLSLPQAVSYLHGHPIADVGEDGWMLVCIQGFPLGWGKRAGGVIKNYYPKGLRWL